LKIGTWEFNKLHEMAADIMLGAESAFLCGKRKRAAECAQYVLDTPGCSVYYPAAKLMLKRCGAKVRKPAVREAVEV
jgi:hypothetical protein